MGTVRLPDIAEACPNIKLLDRIRFNTSEKSMTQSSQTSYRACNLCEAICGLEIEHDGKQVVSIKGDKQDPLSRGHICPKAIALQDIHGDPDRLRTPMRRQGTKFEPISWEDAFDLIESKLTSIRKAHGNNAIALYLGNPTVHNSGALLFQNFLKQALNTRNRFAATSVDQLPHHLAASLMFGHGFLIPIPDIDNTDFMLVLGANPAASNGSLMTAPDVKNRMKSIVKRGGKIIVIDPRETESAKLATQHHFIRPGTDVFFLAAILNVLFAKNLTEMGRLKSISRNVSELQRAVSDFTPTLASNLTGIEATSIEEFAIEFASAKRAVVYGRMGVSTQPHGGLCHWLINAINLVTGNLDRVGGQMFAKPAVSLVGRSGTTHEFGRWKSRVRGLPEFEGDLPVAILAEEITTPGEGQIRALITNSGNPVLSTPNGTQLDEAINQLDFFVALDIYINETTRHADLILPSPSGVETDHYDFAFLALAVRNVARFSPQTFKPVSGSRYDWEIMKELSIRLMPSGEGVVGKFKTWFRKQTLRWMTPDRLLDIGLRMGPYGIFKGGLSLKKLKANPSGIDLGPLQPVLPGMLRTPDKKIDAAPKVYIDHWKQIKSQHLRHADAEISEQPNKFSLIGRRHLRSNNSWMHNSQRLTKGPDRCTLMMNTTDAARLNFEHEQLVSVTSNVGSVRVPLEVTDNMMPGVVSLPHGYGHHRSGTRLNIAEQNPGVSINDLTDDKIVDSLTGNAAFSAQTVRVEAANE